jgi:hypothetical protein
MNRWFRTVKAVIDEAILVLTFVHLCCSFPPARIVVLFCGPTQVLRSRERTHAVVFHAGVAPHAAIHASAKPVTRF